MSSSPKPSIVQRLHSEHKPNPPGIDWASNNSTVWQPPLTILIRALSKPYAAIQESIIELLESTNRVKFHSIEANPSHFDNFQLTRPNQQPALTKPRAQHHSRPPPAPADKTHSLLLTQQTTNIRPPIHIDASSHLCPKSLTSDAGETQSERNPRTKHQKVANLTWSQLREPTETTTPLPHQFPSLFKPYIIHLASIKSTPETPHSRTTRISSFTETITPDLYEPNHVQN